MQLLITVLMLFILYFHKIEEEEDDCVYLSEYGKTCEEKNFHMIRDFKQVSC